VQPKAAEIVSWLARLPADARDRAIEERLGIAEGAPWEPPGEHLLGYHPSGIAPIVRALAEVPVVPEDTVIDLGSGLGKVVLVAALLTGAHARGIEIQAPLVERARAAASRLELAVGFTAEDVRGAQLDDGTVFFLYAPFTGPPLAAALERLHAVAEQRSIVVCALGIDLDRARWLSRRELDAFWLAIYDSRVPGVPPRAAGRSPLPDEAEVVAFDRSA
jgi:SAM-dependent methyltransferase